MTDLFPVEHFDCDPVSDAAWNFGVERGPEIAGWSVLPLYEGESANEAQKPTRWERFKAWVLEVLSAWEEPFLLCELDREADL